MTATIPQMGHVKPKCIAVILCNEIIEDIQTHNKTLVSLFNSIVVPRLPVIWPRMFVMVSLSEGEGDWRVSLTIKNPSGSEALTLAGEVHFGEPTAVMDLVFQGLGMPLIEEGIYFIDVMIDGSPGVRGRRMRR